jgi:hypothetical protein
VLPDQRGVVVEAADHPPDVGFDRVGCLGADGAKRHQRDGAHLGVGVVDGDDEAGGEGRDSVGVLDGDVREGLCGVAPDADVPRIERRLGGGQRLAGGLGVVLGDVRERGEDVLAGRALGVARQVDQRADEDVTAAGVVLGDLREDPRGDAADGPADDHGAGILPGDGRRIVQAADGLGEELRAVLGVVV